MYYVIFVLLFTWNHSKNDFDLLIKFVSGLFVDFMEFNVVFCLWEPWRWRTISNRKWTIIIIDWHSAKIHRTMHTTVHKNEVVNIGWWENKINYENKWHSMWQQQMCRNVETNNCWLITRSHSDRLSQRQHKTNSQTV